MSRRKGIVRFKGTNRFEKDDWNAFIKGVADIGDDISKELLIAEDEIMHKAVKEIKKSSSSNFGNGAYAKDWKLEQDGFDFVVYNKSHYQLTHLLENGHASRGGGFVSGRPHIKPAQDKAEKKAIEEITKAIESYG